MRRSVWQYGLVVTAMCGFWLATGCDDGGDSGVDAHSHDDLYYTETEVDGFLANKADSASLSSAGTINDAANPVDWTQLKGVPACFADGTDDGSGGGGIASVDGVANDGGDVDLLEGAAISIVPNDTSNTIEISVNVGPGSAEVAPGDHTHAIDELSDVVVSGTLAEDEVIAWDTTASAFINQSAAEAGLAVDGHDHDTEYYPQADVDTALSGKADTGHTHAEADLTLSDVTTNNADDTRHGLCPKLSGNVAESLRGDGTWQAASGGASALDELSDVTLASVGDNEVLAYDTSSTGFINQTAAEAGLAVAGHNHDGDYLNDGAAEIDAADDFGFATATHVANLDADSLDGTDGADYATDAELAAHAADVDAHHAKYTDAEALAATAGTYVLKAGDTMVGALELPADGLVAGTDELVIAGGSVGIGTPSPAAKLEVVGSVILGDGGSAFLSITELTGSLENAETTAIELPAGWTVDNTRILACEARLDGSRPFWYHIGLIPSSNSHCYLREDGTGRHCLWIRIDLVSFWQRPYRAVIMRMP